MHGRQRRRGDRRRNGARGKAAWDWNGSDSEGAQWNGGTGDEAPGTDTSGDERRHWNGPAVISQQWNGRSGFFEEAR